MGTRLASAPLVSARIPFFLPSQLLPLLRGPAPLPPQECLLVCSVPVVSLQNYINQTQNGWVAIALLGMPRLMPAKPS